MNRARVSLFGQTVCLATSLAFGLGFAVKATAQWLPDRQYSEGPGIRVGELELHPGIAVRGGYDTNVFKADGKTRGTGMDAITRKLIGAGVLAVTPHLYLSTETQQRAQEGEDKPAPAPRFLAFRAGLSATYFHYFTDNAPRNVAIDTDVFLAIAQGRPVGLELGIGYIRSVSPFTQDAAQRNAYVFDVVDPKLRVKFSSRSGVLGGYVGYAPKYTHYESSVFDYLNNIQHGIEVGAAWKFLPSTALIYDGSLGLQYYTERTGADQALLLYSDSKVFRTRLGINGALTNTISLRALAGYAAIAAAHRALDDAETGIGEVAVNFAFGLHGVEIGYQRDLQLSALGAWYQIDRGFAKVGLNFARRFRLTIDGGVGHANYGRMVKLNGGTVVALGADSDGNATDTSREDIRVDAGLHAEYRATNWLSFMADYVFQTVMTDFEYAATASGGQVIPDPAGFMAHQIFGGVRASY